MEIIYDNSIEVKDYNHLRDLVGWGAILPKQAQKGLDNSAYLVAAKLDNNVIGTARLIHDGGCTAFIVDVIVSPEYQGHGIGKCMIEMIMTYLKNCIEEGEMIFVGLMAAKGREGFYKQFGFIERPNESMGAGMVLWVKEESK